MTPSAGRIVHLADSRRCRAAIVTEVGHGKVSNPGELPELLVYEVHLCVLGPDGMWFLHNVPFSEGEPLKPGETRAFMCGSRDYAPASWHWPARVD